MYILSTRYLEKEAPRFNKITRVNEKTNEDSRNVGTVSNSEEEIKKQALHKKKRNTRALLLTAACPSAFAFPLHRLSTLLSASTSVVSVLILGSALLSASASRVFVPMPGLSALLSILFISDESVPVPGFSASPSILSMSSLTLPVP